MLGHNTGSLGRPASSLNTGADVRERLRRLAEREANRYALIEDAPRRAAVGKPGGRIRLSRGSALSTGTEADPPT